ncbi:response regulator transcription factor [Schaalia sp. 19OD2882]|uniref:LytR/AlgR family response regulator transcription factor n=1 Tax=Schaalia sp. 19OD2882 TaxID=2794089 RepID=UPI001C1EE25A|nr:LytTR family DNA-binding domain-containing protein [Schaalia sp. 19OD2882]QWW20410.1 response regulator transcription factor [Schaalia sp. 19OD2882]
MIRIGVVEDDAVSRKLVLDYLARYEAEHDLSFDVSVFTDGAQILEGYRPRYDIVFLDIQMERIDGLTAAHHIRSMDDQVVIVFITSAAQHAIRGYEVNALSFLLKPLPWFAFEQELTRCLTQVRRRRSASLLLQTGTQMVRVAVEDVIYIESVKHRLTVHTTAGDHSLVGTLKDMEAQLEGHGFFRSNSCYLVNLAHVQGVRDQSCVMTGGEDLRISRPRKRAFLTALTRHAGRSR